MMTMSTKTHPCCECVLCWEERKKTGETFYKEMLRDEDLRKVGKRMKKEAGNFSMERSRWRKEKYNRITFDFFCYISSQMKHLSLSLSLLVLKFRFGLNVGEIMRRIQNRQSMGRLRLKKSKKKKRKIME